MNRIIMRALGGCMAVYGVFFGRDTLAADMTIGGAKYTEKAMSASNMALAYGLSKVAEGEAAPCPGYFFITGLENVVGAPSGGTTATYCATDSYFKAMGCSYSTGVSSEGYCYYTTGHSVSDLSGYAFLGCRAGFYLPKGLSDALTKSGNSITLDTGHVYAPCYLPTGENVSGMGVLDLAQIEACCLPCPQFAYEGDYGTDGANQTTTEWGGEGSNCINDWCWTSQPKSNSTGTVYGMSTCVATYQKDTVEVKDDNGHTYKYTNKSCYLKEL